MGGKAGMSARYLIVDGHSVIFAWADLRKLHDRNRAAARKTLIDRLQHLHDTSDWRVTVVLDGKLGTALPAGVRKPTDMVVSYATADQTADSIIERLVGSSGVARDILVITADEAEKLTVESLGAAAASPSWLREELEKTGIFFTGELERVHRSARWK
ncbi:MAG: NYN domain-containing protein [Methylacidiphilales bacterium]|nr:NYN domain-containing protein [Candidatus Methylacidiphilales bacterium]